MGEVTCESPVSECRGRTPVEPRECRAHASRARKAGSLRDGGDRKIARIEKALGALHAEREGHLQWRCVEVPGKQARQMARADAQAFGQPLDVAAVQLSGFDQGERARDGRSGASPRGTER